MRSFCCWKKYETSHSGKFLLRPDLMSKRQAMPLLGLKDPIHHQEGVGMPNLAFREEWNCLSIQWKTNITWCCAMWGMWKGSIGVVCIFRHLNSWFLTASQAASFLSTQCALTKWMFRNLRRLEQIWSGNWWDCKSNPASASYCISWCWMTP